MRALLCHVLLWAHVFLPAQRGLLTRAPPAPPVGVPLQIPFEDDADVGADFAACKAGGDGLGSNAEAAGRRADAWAAKAGATRAQRTKWHYVERLSTDAGLPQTLHACEQDRRALASSPRPRPRAASCRLRTVARAAPHKRNIKNRNPLCRSFNSGKATGAAPRRAPFAAEKKLLLPFAAATLPQHVV